MKRSLAFAIAAQAVSIIILLLLSSRFFKQLETLSAYTSSVEHAYMVIYQLGEVKSEIKDAETSARGFNLTNKPEFLKLLNTSKTGFFSAMDSLRSLLQTNDTQMIFVKKAEKIGYEIMRMQVENSRLKSRISSDSLLIRMQQGRLQMEEMQSYLEKMKSNELVVLKKRNGQKKASENKLPRYTRSAFFISGLLTLVFGLWIFLELKKRFRFQALLQKKVMELRQNNEELEQIAFAASHDLQEPLRKIRIFSDRLLLKTKENRDEDYEQMAKKINLSAVKLQDLIGDLVTFNNLVQNDFKAEPVSLKLLIEHGLDNMNQKLGKINAVTIISELPVVTASREQLSVLFQQLLENSIQFKSPLRQLRIEISSVKILWSDAKDLPGEFNSGYFYHVQVADNGIGFDEAFKNKMFRPFQRLHNYETDTNIGRKGMGLAICKRVMLNAGGWIDAAGKEGRGATIHLYFPVV